jgi:carbon-monoxide dehydrogenase large subunit
MTSALALARWDEFPQRRGAAARSGKRRGIGIANYIEFTTGAPREWTKVTVLPEGRIDVAIGTLSSGQGHRTSFAQLITDWLGVPFDCVNLIQGDTDIVPVGGGSHSGRSMRLAGIVIGKASDALIARGKRIAAHVLEAAEHDIEFSGGNFIVKGTDRSIGLFDVAREALRRNDLPGELAGPLAAEGDETVTVGGCPYGSHVCEVEVDLELGTVEIIGYAAVDDVGRAVNPRILHGQTHGAIAQGIGQALNEGCVYDRDSAQLLSGSFMDYAIPRARDLSSFATEISEVPSANNPLGVRAGGEGGTTPALAVVVNAIVDALKEFGVNHLEMPVTPERVWRATARKPVSFER